jgi:hypothetical protein
MLYKVLILKLLQIMVVFVYNNVQDKYEYAHLYALNSNLLVTKA